MRHAWRRLALTLAGVCLATLLFRAARAQTTPPAVPPPVPPQVENAIQNALTDNAAPASNTVDNTTSNAVYGAANAVETPVLTPTVAPTSTPTPAATPTPLPSPSPSPTATPLVTVNAPRTILFVLGGVSWDDWSDLASSGNRATPGLRRVLEEGALGAARLPASPAFETAQGLGVENISPAMLRAAAILSSGTTRLPSVPRALALTMNGRERLSAAFPDGENGLALQVQARRQGVTAGPNALVNLGWGQWQSGHQGAPDELLSASLGNLGAMVHRAGGRTGAIGAGDVSVLAGRTFPLREWALSVNDASGSVDMGDVGVRTMARDAAFPFGVRANRKGVLQTLDVLLRDPKMSLISLEWGDTRRAAIYTLQSAPQAQRAHRRSALLSADGLMRALLPRLRDKRDRLMVLCVPDLFSPRAQWLPLCEWRPNRGGQGALLSAGDDAGIVGLENVLPTLAARLNVPSGGTPFVESGRPLAASRRVGRLRAMQAGTQWLSAARPFAGALWAATLSLGVALTLAALRLQMLNARRFAPEREWDAADERFQRSRARRMAGLARALWLLTWLWPLIFWLTGLCLEATWRFGFVSGDWRLSASLLGVAGLTLSVLGLSAVWLGASWQLGRARPARAGLMWLLLTLAGLLLSGFALPWNALLGDSPLESTARCGDWWALCLIGVTLLGVAGLTRARRPEREPGDFGQHLPQTPAPATSPLRLDRRVINLRPALGWMILVLAVLFVARNGAAASVAILGFGAMAGRLWLDAGRAMRRRGRSAAFALVLAFGVLFLWQRGASEAALSALRDWWPQWKLSWHSLPWSAATLAILGGAWAFASGLRPALRAPLTENFAARAMLAGCAVAGVAALLIFGAPGLPIVASFPLGMVLREAMTAES